MSLTSPLAPAKLDASMLIVGVILGGLQLLMIWLIAKPLLHGQMGWLWAVPVVLGLGVTLTARSDLLGPALVLGSLALGFVIGPAWLKHQQIRHEHEFASRVHHLVAGQQGALTGDEAVRAGWDMCGALNTVRGAPENAFPEDDPALSVARIALNLQLGAGQATPVEENQMVDIVHLADRLLC